MYDIRSAMLNIGIVFTPGKFKINLEKTWKTPGILVNLRSTDPVYGSDQPVYVMFIPTFIGNCRYIVIYKQDYCIKLKECLLMNMV